MPMQLRSGPDQRGLRGAWAAIGAAWLAACLAACLALAAVLALTPAPVAAQSLFPTTSAPKADPPPSLTAEDAAQLTPEAIDALLARLSDEDVRVLLRDELARRAEASARDADVGPQGVAAVREGLQTLWADVLERLGRWGEAIANLDQRTDRVAERLALAEDGVVGMVLYSLLVIIAACIAALLVFRVTKTWRYWLMDTNGVSYWDRLIRTLAFMLILMGPILAFNVTIAGVAPLFADKLGPLATDGINYVWIFNSGVTYCAVTIVLSRRTFAPKAPQLRIANVSDNAAQDLHRVNTNAAFIAAIGWSLAGLFPALGYGFPPALITVALTGTLVFAVLLSDVVRSFSDVRETTARLLGVGAPDPTAVGEAPKASAATAGALILRAAAPWLLIGYFTFAYLYWLSLWITTGQQHLIGPIGTLLVGLALPAFDRLGDELVRAAVRGRSELATRFRPVLHGAWRVVLGVVATGIIARLWGLDLLAFAKGETATPWASAIFDIAVALMLGQLIWRLIAAALHRERRIAGADEEEHAAEIPGASRLNTLIPLLRNVLLMVLTIVVMMIVLSSLGVDIGPLLASAGIIGIAIGFGAQALVRDIFSGAFFLIDDAFRVGEYIELDGDLRGEVEAISVRSLQLRHHRGAVVTIPFGELKNITNHSRDWVIYKMSFRLEPDTDPAHVKKIVKRIGAELLADPEHGPKFIQPLKSQGVFMIDDDSALVIRVKFMSKPRMQFVLRREVYHRLRAAFAANDIRFARRKVEVVGADDAGEHAAAAAEAAQPAQPSTLAGAADQR